MLQSNFVTLDSSLEQFILFSNQWCSNEIVLQNLQKSQRFSKEQIAAWLNGHKEIPADSILLDKGHFSFMRSSTRLTPKKVLEYAKNNKLPTEVFQRMIDEIQVPGTPYLVWHQQ